MVKSGNLEWIHELKVSNLAHQNLCQILFKLNSASNDLHIRLHGFSVVIDQVFDQVVLCMEYAKSYLQDSLTIELCGIICLY